MAEFTLEEMYADPTAKPKPVVDPRLVKALVPQTSVLSPKDQRAFELSEAKRKSDEQAKIAEEKRATARKIEEENRATAKKLAEEARQKETKLAEEQRALKQKSEEIDLKKSKNLENLPTLVSRAKSILTGEFVDKTGKLVKTTLPTQSVAGSIIDTVGGVVGIAPEGAAEADRLKVISGALVLAMPRMEGAQSDTDTKLYKEMAGKVGDETIPIKRRLAALEEVEILYSKYNKTPELKNTPPVGAPPDVKQAKDGNWYSPDPKRPGKYLMWGD
jgi:flagellar biosynthesis GTPase FlhF